MAEDLSTSIMRPTPVDLSTGLVAGHLPGDQGSKSFYLALAEMQALIDADIDCTNAARLLMRMQADLVLFIEKRERLKSRESA